MCSTRTQRSGGTGGLALVLLFPRVGGRTESGGSPVVAVESVRHAVPEIEIAIRAYCDGILSGAGAFISHELPGPTDPALVDFSSVASGSFMITNLRGSTDIGTGRASAGHDGDYRQALIAFKSSGTSGTSKTVLYASATMLACASAIADRLRLGPTVESLALVPHEFAFGLSIIHSHLLADAPVTFQDFEDGRTAVDAILRHKRIADARGASRTLIYLLPHQAQAISLAAADVETPMPEVHFAIAGGSLHQAVSNRLSATFPGSTLSNMYGQAELGPRVSTWTGELSRFQEGMMGEPLPGVLLIPKRVEDDYLLWVRSPYRMLRYLAPNDAAASSVVGGSAWDWPTGDIVHSDDAGNLALVGRQSQFVNVVGVRILLADISRAVASCSAVEHYRITTAPSPTLGRIPVVEVSSRDGVSDVLRQAVRSVLNERFGAISRTFKVVTAERITPTPSGKV